MSFSRSKRIYLDYASAPPVLPEAIEAMRQAEKLVGNPGAIHAEGVAAKRSLENSRERIALLLGCKARELVFTSGLTEPNNLAIVGFAKKLEFLRSDLKRAQGRTLGGTRPLAGTHWIVSSIEHDSVLECFAEVERMGGSVTHVDPNEKGIVSAEMVARALKSETAFVSVGWANNEIGTIQPLAKIAHALREHEKQHGTPVIFHADAGQGPLYLSTLVHSLGVDLLALGSNKLYGPHGVGALFVSNRASLKGVMLGGKQERGLRAGTENVALAAGFAAAYEKIVDERESESLRLKKLRDELASELVAHVPGLVINGSTSLTTGGDLKHALPHMLNMSIPNISSEYVTLALDHAGIAVSTKSACREGEESRSHVVAALGGDVWRSQNTLRFSLGRDTSESDIAAVARVITKAVGVPSHRISRAHP